MIPGTFMIFRGVSNNQERADLIAFLKPATVPGGAAAVVAKKVARLNMLPDSSLNRSRLCRWISDQGPPLPRYVFHRDRERVRNAVLGNECPIED